MDFDTYTFRLKMKYGANSKQEQRTYKVQIFPLAALQEERSLPSGWSRQPALRRPPFAEHEGA